MSIIPHITLSDILDHKNMPDFSSFKEREGDAFEWLSLIALERELIARAHKFVIYNDSDALTHDNKYNGQLYTINWHEIKHEDEPIVDITHIEYTIKHGKHVCNTGEVVLGDITTHTIQLQALDAMQYNAYEAMLYTADYNRTHILNIVRNSNSRTTNMDALSAHEAYVLLLHSAQHTLPNSPVMMSTRYSIKDVRCAAGPGSVYMHIGNYNGILCTRAAIRDFHIYMNDIQYKLNVTEYVLAEGLFCLARTLCVDTEIQTQAIKLKTLFPLKLRAIVDAQISQNYAYTRLVPATTALLFFFGSCILRQNSWLTRTLRNIIHSVKYYTHNEHIDHDSGIAQIPHVDEIQEQSVNVANNKDIDTKQ